MILYVFSRSICKTYQKKKCRYVKVFLCGPSKGNAIVENVTPFLVIVSTLYTWSTSQIIRNE